MYFQYNTSNLLCNINQSTNVLRDRMAAPKKITPCPIIESVVEIRFDSAIPAEAIFGVVYNAFNDIFPNKPINLPILQIPEQIRNSDPNLQYKPH